MIGPIPSVRSVTGRVGSALGAELTESEASLRVFLAAAGLIVLGVGLLFMTVWWWRSTRPEPPALGPLEVMSDKKWMTSGESERRRIVEEFRPAGAVPLREQIVAPVPIDLSVLARDVPSFDDLRDVSLDSGIRRGSLHDPERLEVLAAESSDDRPSDEESSDDVARTDAEVADAEAEGAEVDDAEVDDAEVDDAEVDDEEVDDEEVDDEEVDDEEVDDEEVDDAEVEGADAEGADAEWADTDVTAVDTDGRLDQADSPASQHADGPGNEVHVGAAVADVPDIPAAYGDRSDRDDPAGDADQYDATVAQPRPRA